MKWFALIFLCHTLYAVPLPQDIECLFAEAFGHPSRPIYAEMAVDGPHLWTMKLYGINCDGKLLFYTDQCSEKWDILRRSPQVLVMFTSPGAQVQIKALGRLSLRRGDEADLALLSSGQIPYVASQDISRLGVIEVLPCSWKVLDVDENMYARSKHYKYSWQCNCWQINELNPF